MSVLTSIKRLLLGAPIATKHAHHQRLSKFLALPLFASDNISSVAYASEEILLMLILAGSASLKYGIYVALAVVILVLIVITSYTRTIYAYPQGGGDYRVASENLGPLFGRIVGGALMIDYTLTVAVSVSSGVLAIVSAWPDLHPYIVDMGVAAVLLLAFVNLRGLRESGSVFALPTYSFVVLMVSMVVYGIVRTMGVSFAPPPVEPQQALTLFLILRAFAAGCAALTGIEAIADGVPAFKDPAPRNASQALFILAGILVVIFMGVTWLAVHLGITPMSTEEPGYRTVVAQVAMAVFGDGPIFFAIQIATMAILILAANTAFADFPRLCSFMAIDGNLPRQLAVLGDKLVYQNGIILLALTSGGLILAFGGDVHKLIPLYALGVFTAFTLGQAGMVRYQLKHKMPKWGAVVSFIGMCTTGVVWFVVLITKFTAGAYLVVIALTVLVLTFAGIRRHYDYLAKSLNPDPSYRPKAADSTVIVLVPRVHKGILQALEYVKAFSKDVRALHVAINPATVGAVKKEWDEYVGDIPLVILESPYRSLVEPIVEYIEAATQENPDRMLTVVVPQAVPKYWWQSVLHNNSAEPIRRALAAKKNVVITNVRYFLE
ncbi:MAG: APC family permease [Armatimonadetes bacterium]|nr:MAG: APC family permease [Armatimonadota bacterium]